MLEEYTSLQGYTFVVVNLLLIAAMATEQHFHAAASSLLWIIFDEEDTQK